MIPPTSKYNRISRVFTISYNASLIIGREFDMKGGSSIASSAVASIFTLINEERLARKPTDV
jgi:hypothetical protein